MIRSVDLVIHNDLSEIAVVRDTLDRLGSEFAVPAPALMQLQVALDEIVSNVVKYSWPDGSKHKFLVRITVSATGVAARYLRRWAAIRSARRRRNQIGRPQGNARGRAGSVFI